MKKTKKMTWKELKTIIYEHNIENNVELQFGDKDPLMCVIVFKNESWPMRKKNYPAKARSYKFRSDNKYFIARMCGRSIFAETLDGTDSCRLDWYLGDWIIDYCYIMEE